MPSSVQEVQERGKNILLRPRTFKQLQVKLNRLFTEKLLLDYLYFIQRGLFYILVFKSRSLAIKSFEKG
jgi:hypothetical protein